MLRDRNGFTIIEVVLVLAIAGLIFLIVFLALPSLQAARRDTQRKTDMSLLMAKVDTYYGNTGQFPFTNAQVAQFENGYLNANEFVAPDGTTYDIQGVTEDVPNGHRLYPIVDQIFFKARHLCADSDTGPGSDQIQHASASYFSIAVWTLMENGGVRCVDNR